MPAASAVQGDFDGRLRRLDAESGHRRRESRDADRYVKTRKVGKLGAVLVQATGQGVDNSGGKLFVLSPSGRVIKK